MYTPNSTLISFLPHVYVRVHNPREGIKKSKILPKMVGVHKIHYISQVNTKFTTGVYKFHYIYLTTVSL